jgi:hypothetical protein
MTIGLLAAPCKSISTPAAENKADFFSDSREVKAHPSLGRLVEYSHLFVGFKKAD